MEYVFGVKEICVAGLTTETSAEKWLCQGVE